MAAGIGELFELLFWGAVGTVVYVYVGFPLWVLARGLVKRPVRTDPSYTPRVSMIIAAHNEAATIGRKLDNLLSLDYPAERLQIVIGSDGSTDGTNEIVQQRAQPNLQLLSLPRRGKAVTLNAAVAAATGEVLVFSDANSLYDSGALRALVAPLADPHVGAVAGNQVYRSEEPVSCDASGERLYWRFDRVLKWAQSRAGNAISATGAIYAIRRELFQPVPEGVTDDFVISTRAILQGYRLVFVPEAIAYEPPACTYSLEFSRKVRVISRGLRGVWCVRALLNPLRYGGYSIQLFSHKLLRRLVAVPLLVLLIASPCLWSSGWIYRGATILQGMFYALAGLGMLFRKRPLGRRKIFSVPLFFCLVNLAVLVAITNLLRGRHIVVWEPQRQPPVPQPAGSFGVPGVHAERLV